MQKLDKYISNITPKIVNNYRIFIRENSSKIKQILDNYDIEINNYSDEGLRQSLAQAKRAIKLNDRRIFEETILIKRYDEIAKTRLDIANESVPKWWIIDTDIVIDSLRKSREHFIDRELYALIALENYDYINKLKVEIAIRKTKYGSKTYKMR